MRPSSCPDPDPAATKTATDADPAHALEWRLRAATPRHRARLAHARNIVCQALDRGPAYVSISGGKDSVALLGLVREAAPEVAAWHIDSGMESPDTVAVIDRLHADYGLRVAQPEHSIDEMARLVGQWGYDGADKLAGEWHWLPADFRRILIADPAAALEREHGYRLRFVGLRADESKGRTQRMRRYGAIHTHADDSVTACPLAWWSGRDSLAYCYSHDLPISGVYWRAGRTPPHERRTGTMLGTSAIAHGRLSDLRATHPETWRRIVAMFPDLRTRA